MLIKNDPDVFEEIRSAFFPGLINARQHLHRDFQSGGGSCLFHEVLGNGERMKDDALAGTGDVRKQAMLNRIVF